MKHSTRTPTNAEAKRMASVKEGPCLACYLRGMASHGVEAHHLLSGNKRIGHMATVGLCAWHHRAVPFWGMTHAECREEFGPSLAEGSKPFHAAFGSDAELLELQNRLLA